MVIDTIMYVPTQAKALKCSVDNDILTQPPTTHAKPSSVDLVNDKIIKLYAHAQYIVKSTITDHDMFLGRNWCALLTSGFLIV